MAISNHRLISIDLHKIGFTYKDRRKNNQRRLMTLSSHEFIRRFLLHMLPRRFVKIRYFEFMFHREKRSNIALIHKLLKAPVSSVKPPKQDARQLMLTLTGIDIHTCSKCKKGQLIVIGKIPRGSHSRDPRPHYFLNQ